jgi:phosphate starvation-inducible PhoH-like protein
MQLKMLVRDGKVEVCPLAYMRGRTFDDAFIIGDEMQNSTPTQMKMLLTRIGNNSKLVITGDMNQHDRGFEENGLLDLTHRLYCTKTNFIAHVNLTDVDVMRSEAVKEVLRMYL